MSIHKASPLSTYTQLFRDAHAQIKNMIYLINTNTHCKTPAVPVHTEGPVLTIESCINKPTDAARETKDTTYAKKSQSFNLLQLRNGVVNISLGKQTKLRIQIL